jgi:DNA-binding response OmpR family regulator
MLLEQHGFRVRSAASGERALELSRDEPPDAILLDLGLPGLDGWGVLAALREEPRTDGIPVVIFTAAARGARREMGSTLEWVEKPYTPAALLDALDRALESRIRLRRVLLIAGDGQASDGLTDALRVHGLHAQRAATAAEAVAFCATTPPDLVILDLGGGGGAGPVVDALREQGLLGRIPLLVHVGTAVPVEAPIGSGVPSGDASPDPASAFARQVAELLVHTAPCRPEAS